MNSSEQHDHGNSESHSYGKDVQSELAAAEAILNEEHFGLEKVHVH